MLVLCCCIAGLGFRFANAVHKIYYQDEAVTSLRAMGHTIADENAFFDRKTHPMSAVTALLRVHDGSIADTVTSLAYEDPHHPPAFYVAEAVWTRIGGSSPFALRLLAIGFGMLVVPLGAALAWELYGNRRTAALAAAFFAVSPFFVLYGYQAREYGTFAATALLASLAYVRARRIGGPWVWTAYAASVAIGSYVHLFMILVILAHAISALADGRRRTVLPFALAATTGLALAAPWYWIVTENARTANVEMAWALSPYPLPFMLAKWLFFATSVFFDAEYLSSTFVALAAIVFLALAFAAYRGLRDSKADTRVFLIGLGSTTFVALALPDVLLQHRVSTIGRYLTPTWIVLILVVACYAGTRLGRTSTRILVSLLLVGAVGSDILSARSSSWWENSGSKNIPALAGFVTLHPALLLISENDNAPLLVLAPLMPQSALWRGYIGSAIPSVSAAELRDRPSLLSPTDIVRQRMRARVRLENIYDSHDFSTNLSRVRGATAGEAAGHDDWGETVLYALAPRVTP